MPRRIRPPPAAAAPAGIPPRPMPRWDGNEWLDLNVVAEVEEPAPMEVLTTADGQAIDLRQDPAGALPAEDGRVLRA